MATKLLINLTTQEGSCKDHDEARQYKLCALVGEHGKPGADHEDDDDQTPVLLLQLEEEGEHEDEHDAGGLGDGVERHVNILKTPLGQSDVQRCHHGHNTYPAQDLGPS